MKKTLLFFMILGTMSFGKMPKEIKTQITQQAREIYDDARDAKDFIEWQESSYNEIEKTLAESEIPQENKDQIRFYLRGKYGVNFIKQNGVLLEEINRVKNSQENVKIATTKEVERILSEKKLSEIKEEINEKAEKELKVIEKTVEIPQVIMERFKAEAERLYPGNYYEQKRYIESSIGNYKFYKNLK